MAKTIPAKKYYELFKNYHACFILYDVNEHKILSKYNPYNRCHQRIAPNSTFKIPLSLMAFNQGIINQNTVFKWNGEKGVLPEHEQDQTPSTWLKYSVVWVSQQLTPQLGSERIEKFLAGFDYGNQDFSGDPGKNNGLTNAWLSGSLKISAHEQLEFLKAMLKKELPVSDAAVESTKKNLYQGTLANNASFYGKTGSGHNGKLRDGWFIGFIEKGDKRYIFVSNLTDKVIPTYSEGKPSPYGGQIIKPITIQLLNDYFT